MDLYEAMYVALVRRLEEIADEVDSNSGRTLSEYNRDRLADYDRVARAHALGLEIRKDDVATKPETNAREVLDE